MAASEEEADLGAAGPAAADICHICQISVRYRMISYDTTVLGISDRYLSNICQISVRYLFGICQISLRLLYHKISYDIRGRISTIGSVLQNHAAILKNRCFTLPSVQLNLLGEIRKQYVISLSSNILLIVWPYGLMVSEFDRRCEG